MGLGAYKNKRVFVTGNTGFKGSWLSAWLVSLGAEVYGFSLGTSPSEPNMYDIVGLKAHVRQEFGDIRDLVKLSRCLKNANPEIVFHLAAQSLVSRGYSEPLTTLETNVMGTAHVLDLIRETPFVQSAVIVTSDKCYATEEHSQPHTESTPLGGDDPYSASKAAAELITRAYTRSFFDERKIGVATVRAGNVIGGGDWSQDRLIPDVIRAARTARGIKLRSPDSIRPWQHVLEPLSGYLWLGLELARDPIRYTGPWNFGPVEGLVTVRELVSYLISEMPKIKIREGSVVGSFRENPLLQLDSRKAEKILGWRAVWDIATTIEYTAAWYQLWLDGAGSSTLWEKTLHQLSAYMMDASDANVRWATGEPQ